MRTRVGLSVGLREVIVRVLFALLVLHIAPTHRNPLNPAQPQPLRGVALLLSFRFLSLSSPDTSDEELRWRAEGGVKVVWWRNGIERDDSQRELEREIEA